MTGDVMPDPSRRRRRWVVSMVVLGTVVVIAVFVGLVAKDTVANLHGEDRCAHDAGVMLVAQSVPTAAAVPCLTSSLEAWSVTGREVNDGGSQFELTTSQIDGARWSLHFTATCSPDPGAREVTSDDAHGPVPVQVLELVEASGSSYRMTDWYRFSGGCVESEVYVPYRVDRAVVFADVDEMLRLVPRSRLEATVSADTDGQLSFDPPPSTVG